MSISVQIKHAGKSHAVDLDTSKPASVFKDAIYQLTGVPVDRMKVMIKGGMLKDDTDWKKIAPKPNQTFMVIGAAGELPKPPEKPIVFLEDMEDSELAAALAIPVGLINLGNTCYMNSTVQALRAVPELHTALQNAPAGGSMAVSLKNLYTSMTQTTSAVMPAVFLNQLRTFAPQFAEQNPSGKGGGYAQQDAEECWGQMLTALKDVPGISSEGSQATKKFVQQYMMGEVQRTLQCDEAPSEEPTISSELVGNIKCNISISTNYMHTGLMEGLTSTIEKFSPTLQRNATYTQTSRLTRLPTYLTVHMVRFAWRTDIGKKTKVMRKVKFPLELDALDFATEDLKAKMLPVSRQLKEFEKARSERRKVRARTKQKVANTSRDVEMTDATGSGTTSAVSAAAASGDVSMDAATKLGDELQEERVYREDEKGVLMSLVAPELSEDTGSSASGLYDLVALVTHKGAHADGGHYMAYVKKKVFHEKDEKFDDSDEGWYKFDDEKVSEFPAEKLGTLDGGGEDSSAYVLLYKSKSLD